MAIPYGPINQLFIRRSLIIIYLTIYGTKSMYHVFDRSRALSHRTISHHIKLHRLNHEVSMQKIIVANRIL